MVKIVYSTSDNWEEKCPECLEPVSQCVCEDKKKEQRMPDKIYIHRDRKGRKGKTVTVVTIWSSDPRSDLKELQKLCGAGGTHKQNTLEIQGDHVDKIKSYLEAKDLTVRISGG